MLVLEGPRLRVESLVFSPDGTRLFAPRAGRLGVSCWDLAAGATEPGVWLDDVLVRSVEFTPDGKWLLACGQWVFLYRVATRERTEVKFPKPYDEWATAAFTPDGKRFVATLGWLRADPPSRLVCRSVADPQADAWSAGVHRYFISGAMFLPGNRRFVTFEWGIGDPDPSDHGLVLATRHHRTGKVISEARHQGTGYADVARSPDGRLLAARYKSQLTVFRAGDPAAPPAVVTNTTRKAFTDVAFDPSGRYLAATSNDETVKLWDTAAWRVAKTLHWKAGRLRSVAFSPDGTRAAAGTDKGQVVVWDVDV